ncbi:hypothetical protein HY480_02715 [Candidatus Uhrbacteria bacterium]|nr:hypothetical protein [Candidatus Uhrbacteria bacterium]
MTTKQKSTGSIREAVRRAREAGHDTLGLTSDPETRGALEFVALIQNLTDRLVDRFGGGGTGPHAADVARAIWEPVARCMVRAMVREMCVGSLRRGRVTKYADPPIGLMAAYAIERVRPRLGGAITEAHVPPIVRYTAEVFSNRERFTQPTELRCREVPYHFHRKGSVLVVRQGSGEMS